MKNIKDDGKKAWSGNGDKNRTGREEKRRRSSHGRERAGGNGGSELRGNWGRLWRRTVVVWVSILGEYTREIVLVSLDVSVSAQGEIEAIETENTGVDLHAKRVWGFYHRHIYVYCVYGFYFYSLLTRMLAKLFLRAISPFLNLKIRKRSKGTISMLLKLLSTPHPFIKIVSPIRRRKKPAIAYI